MPNDLTTLLCTCPDTDTGERIASALVEQRLAACVNLVGGVRSFYRWQGRVDNDAEILLIIKTTGRRVEALEERIRELHPYDVPEVIALPIVAGSEPYLDWLRQETT